VLSILLIFSMSPIAPSVTAAEPELLNPIDGRNILDLQYGVTTSGYDAEIREPKLEIEYAAAPANTALVLASIGNKTVNEGSMLTFTAEATDADIPANTLTYSLVGAPSGASINATTGVFTWTPTEAQGPDSYTFTVRVSDGALTDEEIITVTVNEVNQAPVLAAIGNKMVDEESLLTFTAVSMDADLPANTLTYSLVGAPSGAIINAMTGVFTWTPTEAQGPGSYTFAVRVSDGALNDQETIIVTVNEVNAAPVLAAIGKKEVDEGTELRFTATATDSDSAILTYSLVGAPSGASINAVTGEFTWTPTEAQGPGSYTFTVRVSDGALIDEKSIIVTVNEVNVAPVLNAIGNKTVNEGSLLTVTAEATDADIPANTLTYSLVGAPSGASINATTGVFTWTPTEAQGPGSYTFTVRVSDGALTDQETITVTVNEVNKAPVLQAIGSKSVNQGILLSFTAVATDEDEPANTLTYSLVDAPDGAAIDSATGEFTWRPSAAQSSKMYTFTVRVSDGSLTDEEVITVTVKAVQGNDSTINEPERTGTAVNVLDNGKGEHEGAATITEANGQKVITIAVDEEMLMQRLKDEGKQAVITIPVTIDSDVVIAEFNGSLIKSMANQQAIIVLQTSIASYTLPAEQIDFSAVSAQLGANMTLEDVTVRIEIAKPLQDKMQIVKDALNREGLTEAVPPLNFKVSVEYDGRTIEIVRFNAYVKRTIAIPDGIDPNRITTGVVVEQDGTIRHVPTKITEVGGTHYAVIHSLTNSTFALVWNPLKFIDVENHWAKDAVNNMGSRMIVNGMGKGIYNPDQDITRAEFAAIIVRGLGLRLKQGDSIFTDVNTTDWYRGAVQIAYEYGLINGFEDGTFRPNDKITREQAMLIVSKAMVWTGLKGSAVHNFPDANTVSKWALSGVADSVSSGIVSGRNNNLLAPQANITRAEVAMIVQKLLQKSDLIN